MVQHLSPMPSAVVGDGVGRGCKCPGCSGGVMATENEHEGAPGSGFHAEAAPRLALKRRDKQLFGAVLGRSKKHVRGGAQPWRSCLCAPILPQDQPCIAQSGIDTPR